MALPKDRYFYRFRGHYFPTPKLALSLHQKALDEYGGFAGIRDEGALQSSFSAPLESAGGQDAYPTFFWKLSAIGYRIAKNHCFKDANKRTTWLSLDSTLEYNSYFAVRPSIEIEDIMVLLAAGHLDIAGLRAWLLMACYQDYNDENL